MPDTILRTSGQYTITCYWDVVPSDWVQEKMLLFKNGNGLDFTGNETLLAAGTHPAINAPTTLCYNLINKLEQVPYITEVHLYAHGAMSVILEVTIRENKSSACMRADQLQALGEAEFLVCAIIEKFAEENPVE